MKKWRFSANISLYLENRRPTRLKIRP